MPEKLRQIPQEDQQNDIKPGASDVFRIYLQKKIVEKDGAGESEDGVKKEEDDDFDDLRFICIKYDFENIPVIYWIIFICFISEHLDVVGNDEFSEMNRSILLSYLLYILSCQGLRL